MLSRVYCGCCDGLNVNTITVEVSVSEGIQFFLVGLADSAVRESQQRIENALNVYGYRIPGRKVVINLAPANIRKEGSGFDLPIAIGILAASGQIEIKGQLDKFLILGELALDGSLRSITGALPIINHAKKRGFKWCILPATSAYEGADIDGIEIYAAHNLKDVIEIIKNPQNCLNLKVVGENKTKKRDGVSEDLEEDSTTWEYDFSQVVGQKFAKKGLEIAVGGGHNVIMVGSPGCGKTFMAKCLQGILPPMTKEESIQTSEIYSVANLLNGVVGLIKKRPYRSPHHTITVPALIGGGNKGMPGEISLAHNGILFADEFAEFDRKAIEVLRQPLENGTIEISRVKSKYIYPAQFMFVAAMNPCPCGHLYDSPGLCNCSSSQIAKYQSKISGPILDRIDIYLKIREVKTSEILNLASMSQGRFQGEESSADIAKRVRNARDIQLQRYKSEKFFTNASIPQSKLSTYCKLGIKEEKFLAKVIESLHISARGYTRIVKIARTIADINSSEKISIEDLSLALQLRYPDG